jgi:hypothetical protein
MWRFDASSVPTVADVRDVALRPLGAAEAARHLLMPGRS